MNDTTNNSEQHAGNGDTATHSQKANESLARKYYTQVEGKTLDEARDIIKRLVSKGMLKDATFYNEAIAKDTKEKERVIRREAAKKEQAERDAQARADFEAKREAEREAEQSGDYTLDPLVEAQIKDFIEKGATKAVIQGMLKVLTKLNKIQIAKVIADLMPERAKSSGFRGERNAFMSQFLDNKMTIETFNEYMSQQSTNVQKRMPFYKSMFEHFNAIHDKYSNQ